ncbi:MAG: hypothetical protein P4M09_11115, partial [Devosia sp.]|nr:hypothetical protein [Devosia sp.]
MNLLYQGVENQFDETNYIRENTPDAPGLASETRDSTDPKLREECGVVAIHGHPDAARQAYLGVYALQHRGLESAGIATPDGLRLAISKGMGLVSEIFT